MVGPANWCKTSLNRCSEFVDQVYVPDLLAIASFYKDWGGIGNTGGNFLSFGDFPGKSMWDADAFLVPRGVILGGDVSKDSPRLTLDKGDEIQEFRQPFLVQIWCW
jgi:hydrogenase large subunit